jgi:hypothetical protein
MGVNKIIGRFFVDRRLPENNSFWEGRLLYIGVGNGYVSIPVFYDILFRIGLPMDQLLDENHILYMEQLMHFAILQEKNKISKTEERKYIGELLTERVKDSAKYEALNRYHDQKILKPMGGFGMIHPSLNRADMFLFVLCDLPLTESQWQIAIRYWYALHPSYLIMDDIRDFSKDKKDGEDNVVLELGGDAGGFEKALEMLQMNADVLQEINPSLGEYIKDYEERLRKFIPENF